MGNELCHGESTQSLDLQGPLDKEKNQMSTVIPQENGSSHNELYRGDLEQDGRLDSRESSPADQNPNEPQSPKVAMNAVPKRMEVKYEKMQVVRPAQKKKRINQFQIEVPFDVIFLTLSRQLKHTVHEMGHDLFEKYYNQSGTSGWKLHKNGYYINYLAKKLTAILTETIYFEGELEENAENRIYPKASGILLDRNGRFEGKFQNGKANGVGSFEDHIKNAYFKGLWKDGKMVEGVIDSKQYQFKGAFHDNIAQGWGKLHFKNNGVSYTGQFKKGKYYDKKGLYQANEYVYEGCFINGKKNQQGRLVQKERNYKNNKVKYRPPCQFSGFWSEDIYFSSEALAQVKANQQSDLKDSKLKEDKMAVPNIQNIQFEESEEKASSVPTGDQKVGNAVVMDDSFQSLKPRFIWVQPPRPEKKKKKKKEDQDPDAF